MYWYRLSFRAEGMESEGVARIFTFLIGIIILLSACTANRALPAETGLFPNAKQEKWWIINIISKDENGKDLHLSALIRASPAYGSHFTQFFTSLWLEADSSYYAGAQAAETPFHQKKYKFPIKLTIPAKDSVSLGWSWRLDRKNLRLQSVVQDETNKEWWPLIMKIKFRNDSAFNVLETSGELAVQHLPPTVLDMSLSGTWSAPSPGLLHFHVITSGEKLLEKTKRSFISWLDMDLPDGTSISLLYETNRQGKVTILNQACWPGEQISESKLSINTDPQKNWKSPRSNTAYPLRFSITIPEKNRTILVTPRLENQEISMQKSAFWMGAVQATDSITGAVVGKGNLYILKQ